ncbi:Diacylglycerol kinase theta [Dissostichus eleginoides]|uniref:Diacylglycerol kinase n=1 Tax=Dissostichus eleginoides TaxID=100907 RepID=A0AAD9CMC7_DISEL|nr:Diacylglycerol kinase theta [Dissostichus eleginoides]
MADCRPANPEDTDSRTSSPLAGKKRAQQSPVPRNKHQIPDPGGHCLRKVTLTKPTFCHSCSDFIWGLVGFLCEVCNFMCHEKCLKTLRSACSCMTPSLVQVPVSHCFGPAGQKKRFCSVCRKQTEGNTALRCEDCRSSQVDGTLQQDTFHHHWREGNLPAAARCDVCRRSCSSSDVMTGTRCEWCGITRASRVHSGSSALHDASSLLRPPRLQKLQQDAPIPLMIWSRLLQRLKSLRLQSQKLHFSTAECSVCTYSVCTRATRNEEVVEAVLRSFFLPGDPQDFELKEVVAVQRLHSNDILNRNGDHDNRSPENGTPDNRTPPREGCPDNAWLLRLRPRHPEVIEVFSSWNSLFMVLPAGVLSVSSWFSLLVFSQSLHGSPCWCSPSLFMVLPAGVLPVSSWFSLLVFSQSLHGSPCWCSLSLFMVLPAGVLPVSSWFSLLVFSQSLHGPSSRSPSLKTAQQRRFSQRSSGGWTESLMEVYMSSKQVQRQTLSPQEKILEKLQEIRKVSLRQMNQTRLVVVPNRKGGVLSAQQGVQVSLLIGGLDPLLSREEYESLLVSVFGHLVSFSHFYSSQGAVALQVSCFSEAERVFMLARDTSVNEKNLSSVVIPEIMLNCLSPDVCPLLVFVNPRSGGLKGRDLLYGFRKLLNPHQVFDISNGGPLAGLHTFREVPRFRVLVCGGDGTIGWVLGVLEAVRHKLVCREPPIGIVPLGTGYSGEDPPHILVSVDEAEEVLMDRWTILLDAQHLSEDAHGFLEPPKIVQMNNYFGLGIDAELSLDFHQAREDEPDKFTSRFHNKGVYVKVGLQKISCSRSLHKELKLQVDAQEVQLPNIEGLIFLNIPSWGSGADLWGSEVDSRYGKPRIDDGLLEVVGVTGVVHMGNYIRLTVSKPIPVQVDGEPWIQPPGHIIISAAGPKVRMLRKSKQKQKKSSASKDGRSESPSSRDAAH